MKKTLLCTIAATGMMFSGYAFAQADLGGEACERLEAYIEENRGRDLGVEMDQLRRLQERNDPQLCQDQMAWFEARDEQLQAQTGQQQLGGQQDTMAGQQGEPLFGQEQQTAQQGQQQLDQQELPGGQIIVQQPAPALRIDQAEPQVTVRQQQPDVRVTQQQPEIMVYQPAPQVTVLIPQPQITVRMPEPQVAVSQNQPQVSVQQAEPQVSFERTEQPQVMMDQGGEAQVRIQQPQGQANVQLQQSGQPNVRYQAEEPQVQIQQAEGGPQVQFERMEGEQQQMAGQQQQGEQTGSTEQQFAATDPQQEGQVRRVTASDLGGTMLVNLRGDELGEVEALVVDLNDNRTYAIVAYGGFLGVGERLVALPLQNLRMLDDQLVVEGLSDEELRAMPEYVEGEGNYRELTDDQPAEIRITG